MNKKIDQIGERKKYQHDHKMQQVYLRKSVNDCEISQDTRLIRNAFTLFEVG